MAAELGPWLKENDIGHIRRRPYHPITQGKIERWHRSLNNTLLLEQYFLPEELERRIVAFFRHYNTERYHESLDNITP